MPQIMKPRWTCKTRKRMRSPRHTSTLPLPILRNGPEICTPTCLHNGPMAAVSEKVSGTQRDSSLLVTIVDVSDTYSQSLQLENPSAQVTDVSRKENFNTDCFPLQLSVTQCLDNVTTFLNSYLLLEQTNSVGVCLCYGGGRLALLRMHAEW